MPNELDELRGRRRAAFGAALRAARLEAGLTQEALANLARMDRSFYVELENAMHSTTVDRVCDLAAALKVPVRKLFEDHVFDAHG